MTAQNEAAAGLVERAELLRAFLQERLYFNESQVVTTLLAQVEELRRERDEWKRAANGKEMAAKAYYENYREEEDRVTATEALVAEGVGAVQGMLNHSCISDIPDRDKFDEDRDAERAARSFIAAATTRAKP